MTKAYKRKLEERKRYEAEEEERQREEDANDVTKKTAGAAFAGFYGNFNRNVAMGGKEEIDGRDKDKPLDDEKASGRIGNNNNNGSENDDDFKPKQGGLGFLAGFERPEGVDDPAESQQETMGGSNNKVSESFDLDETKPTLSIREIREKKVAEARIRYLERKQMAPQ